MRVFLAQCNPIIGDIKHNTKLILQAIKEAKEALCDLVVFSELALCGYCPDDLLLDARFVEKVDSALVEIAQSSVGITAIVGTVRENTQLPGKPLCNSAAVLCDGQILGFQDKCLLPTYDVFDEWRYFEPAKSERVWGLGGKKIGITICEDIWKAFDPFLQGRYADDPLDCFEHKNVDLLINISASPYSLGKIKTRMLVAKKVAKRLNCPVALVNQVGANDSLLFDGSSFVVSQHDELLVMAKSFSSDGVIFDLQKPHAAPPTILEPGHELFMALVMGVKDYFSKQGFSKAVLGLSGGIDSSVVAAIAVEALGKENVLGLFMPSHFTSSESREYAFALAKNLGIECKELSIEPPLEAFLHTLGAPSDRSQFGIMEENLQSRIRGVLLMAISNKQGHMVLNTGNKSELAMGYTTLYGDSVGAIGVLGDLLKRQVMQVASFINKHASVIPAPVLIRPPSAELAFNQKDSDTLPEYPVLDTIVDEYVVHQKTAQEIAAGHGYDTALVTSVIKQIHQNEYKRSQLPFGLRVSEKAFSVGRKVPIVSKPF